MAPGGRSLVRAIFYYGNYDGLNEPPTFDLYLGVNRWATVNVTSANGVYIFEAVAVSPADFVQVSVSSAVCPRSGSNLVISSFYAHLI